MPGSQFEYSARLTEMSLLGVLAQRLNTRIEYDAENMKVTNHPDFDKYKGTGTEKMEIRRRPVAKCFVDQVNLI